VITPRWFDVVCRAEVRGSKLGGYAAVFDQTTDLGGGRMERIAPTAFAAALADPSTDVRALWNHDPQFLLGRQSVGTLRLSVDSHGLEYEVDLPDTSYARDARVLAERGDLDGASFSFIPGQEERDGNVRVHTSVRGLYDVSPVTVGAYGGATTEARSLSSGTSRASQLIRARYRSRRTPGGVIISASNR
jgi:HK97 family phage prohead protease